MSENLLFFLIEFVCNYEHSITGKEVMTSKMKSYMFGLQRWFKHKWNYEISLKGPIFDC